VAAGSAAAAATSAAAVPPAAPENIGILGRIKRFFIGDKLDKAGILAAPRA
jgi:hypothetical protein